MELRLGLIINVVLCCVNAAPANPGKEVPKLRLDTPVHQARQQRGSNAEIDSAVSSESSDVDDEYDDIYDITVGDVIRDVLLTLRDHPEIVKVLIEREKEKMTDQMTDFSSLSSSEDDMSEYVVNDTEILSLKPVDAFRTARQLQQRVRKFPFKRNEEIAVDTYVPQKRDDNDANNVNKAPSSWFDDKVEDVQKMKVGYNPELDLPDNSAVKIPYRNQHGQSDKSRDQQQTQNADESDPDTIEKSTDTGHVSSGRELTDEQIVDRIAKRGRPSRGM